jgi:hypothetical protein
MTFLKSRVYNQEIKERGVDREGMNKLYSARDQRVRYECKEPAPSVREQGAAAAPYL